MFWNESALGCGICPMRRMKFCRLYCPIEYMHYIIFDFELVIVWWFSTLLFLYLILHYKWTYFRPVSGVFNPFWPGVSFHIETSHMICRAKWNETLASNESRPCKSTMIKLFAKIKTFRSELFSLKRSIMDLWQSPKFAFDFSSNLR